MITIAVSYQPFVLYLQGGAWLVAYRAEQRRRFKAVICGGDPILQRQSAVTKLQSDETDSIEEERPQKLDGFFLVSLWVFYDHNYRYTIGMVYKHQMAIELFYLGDERKVHKMQNRYQ